MKRLLHRILPGPVWSRLHYVYNLARDLPHVARFLARPHPTATLGQKIKLLWQFLRIDRKIDCAHRMNEVLWFVDAILSAPHDLPGDFAECGAFKGGSTAKFSLACALAGRKLLVFDSFEGIPENDEAEHRTLDGKRVSFPEGSYVGGLDEVRANIAACGDLSVCEFVKGFFDDTLPHRQDRLAGVYLDVDLASSTRTCIQELYPKLSEGGWLMSQDGHLNLVLDVFRDRDLWERTLGVTPPKILGFGTQKLIRQQKAFA